VSKLVPESPRPASKGRTVRGLALNLAVRLVALAVCASALPDSSGVELALCLSATALLGFSSIRYIVMLVLVVTKWDAAHAHSSE
jgi:hypothetical protein